MLNKRECIGIVFLALVVFSIFGGIALIHADDSEDDSDNVNDTIQNLSEIDKSFMCLANLLKPDCSGAENIQQLSLSILSSVNISSKCVDRLLTKSRNDECFGENSCSILDTAFAILALNHVKKDTTKYVDWLSNQSINSTGVDWILQQNSDGETKCKLTYDNTDYNFLAAENKKLSGNVGPCFSFTQSNFWLKLNPNCIGKKIELSCDSDYYAGWSFWGKTNSGAPVLNVLSETARKAADDKVEITINSECFGIGSSCDFEETAWATLAIKSSQGTTPANYIPFLISSEDTNKRYFPSALISRILDFSSNYATKVLQQLKGTHWEIEGSKYGSTYDTSLALMAVGNDNNADVRDKAILWLKNTARGADGCWNKNIRDTAIALWAIEGRHGIDYSGSDPIIPPQPPACTGEGLSCLGSALSCTEQGGVLSSGYSCGTSGNVCCAIELKSCTSYHNGQICSSDQTCSIAGIASSEGSCCTGVCEDRNDPSDGGDDYDDYDDYEEDSRGIPIWVWLLIGILIILIILAIVFRDRIKGWFYKQKNKKKDDKGSTPAMNAGGSRGPPRAGFPPTTNRPPIRPMIPQNRPQIRPNPQPNKTEDPFSKLKEMTK